MIVRKVNMKIEELTQKLENRSYTTKELTELGISRYNINKLIEAAVLTRTSIGHYDCKVVVKQSKEALEHFNAFIRNVFKREYEAAFKELKLNFETRTSYVYDNHLRIYFTILNKLISEPVDLDFLSELRCKDVQIETEQDDLFNRFLSNLDNNNTSKAFYYLKNFKSKEEQALGYSTTSTKLFYNLMIGVRIKEHAIEEEKIKLEEQRKIEEQQRLEEQRKQAQKKAREDYYIYGNLIRDFDFYLENDRYEDALNIVDSIIERAHSKYKDNYLKMKKMLETYFDLKNNNSTLPELNIEYSSDDFNYIFNTALVNEDYQTALRNVGKLIYLNPNSKVLQQYRKLLFLISDINKRNLKSASKPTPVIALKKETVKSKYVTSIDSEELYNLVYDADHQKLYELLDSYFKNPNYERNRTYHNLYNMLKVLVDLSTDKYRPITDTTISAGEYDTFGYFFEAMRKRNYRAAYSVVAACDEKNKERNNSNEFELYKYMLQDLIKELDRYEEEQIIIGRIKEYDDSIDEYIYHRGAYTKDELRVFLKLLEAKKAYMIENYMDLSDDEEKLMSLLRTIDSFENFYGQFSDYFDRKEYTGTLVDKFNASMEYGDYPSSLEFITSPEWIDKTRNALNKKYLEAYKKLLFALKNSTVALPVEKKEEEAFDISEPEAVTTIKQIKSLIKRNDYVGAYILYVESDLDETNPELKIYLDTILKYLVNYQTNESLEYLNKYKEYYRMGDIERARYYLDKYKSSIENTGLDRSLDYHYDRVERLEQNMNSKDFVLLENLYDRAKYYLENRQYQLCISTIDEYVLVDSNSPRAYLLRGRAYEYLKQYEEARADYLLAINISKEPNALYRLGKLAIYKSDYDGAYAYLKDYQERRPYVNYDVVRALVECEEKTSVEEKHDYMKVYKALKAKKSE